MCPDDISVLDCAAVSTDGVVRPARGKDLQGGLACNVLCAVFGMACFEFSTWQQSQITFSGHALFRPALDRSLPAHTSKALATEL